MQPNAPIGIFDSGIGGTSIWKEIHALLPHEATLYLADKANAPYGNRSREEIIALSEKNTQYLLKQGCKLIVVACNTATTNAIQHLRDTFDVPFIGIEPAIKPAALRTKNKSIGILATQGTLSSDLFYKTSSAFANDIKVTEVVGKGLVDLIESGKALSQETGELLQEYLKPMLEAKIDYLVLGCTHYPYLMPQLKALLPEGITIIDSGEAVARQTKAVLEHTNLLAQKSKPTHRFYSNADTDILHYFLRDYLAEIEIKKVNF